jgi:hypothetical protein
MGNYHKFFEFKPHGDHLRSEFSNIVLVGATDLSDEAMYMKPFDRARNLSTASPGEFTPEIFVLKSAYRKLSARDGFQEKLVLIIKKIETFIRAIAFDNRLGDFVKFLNPNARIVDGGDKFDVPAV